MSRIRFVSNLFYCMMAQGCPSMWMLQMVVIVTATDGKIILWRDCICIWKPLHRIHYCVVQNQISLIFLALQYDKVVDSLICIYSIWSRKLTQMPNPLCRFIHMVLVIRHFCLPKVIGKSFFLKSLDTIDNTRSIVSSDLYAEIWLTL